MHTLSATLYDIELNKTRLRESEEKLRRREDEFVEFQPTIIKMEKQKPGRYDRNLYAITQATVSIENTWKKRTE